MDRLVHAAALLLGIAVVSGAAAAGCSSDLTATTPGHDQCTAAGQCAEGFVCEQGTCVPAGSTTTGAGGHGGATTATGGSGGAGTGGSGGAGTGGSTLDGGGGGDACGDVMTDPLHCGTCGHACPVPAHGSATCASGTCGIKCDPTYSACGSACVDPMTDPDHCGSCNPCDPPISGGNTGAPSCVGGLCNVACNTTTMLDCAVGSGHACVDPTSDPQACNDCGTHCPTGKKCVSSACVPACAPGLTLCGSACVNLQDDTSHCGSCGAASCTLSCGDGACNVSCPAGLTACGFLVGVGCVDKQTDSANCGSCGHACSAGQMCVAGGCTPFIFANGPWECAFNGNALPVFCPAQGVCIGAGLTCP